MVRTGLSALGCVALGAVTAGYTTWPSETDYLEFILYEQISDISFSPMSAVVPCEALHLGPGRSVAAEWIRAGFHDMATADVEAGTGGLDASIAFELDRPENPGVPQFGETFNTTSNSFTSRASMADLLAMEVLTAAGSCSGGKVGFPYRAGRIDATGPGPKGVPEPTDDIDSTIAAFKRQGFTKKEMIGLVACGHTLGGVHGADFPEIVDLPANNTDGDIQHFDEKFQLFDNKVATEYLASDKQNPLAFGHNISARSDDRVFSCDGKAEIKRLAASNDAFLKTCSNLLERMVNTVPKDVKFTQPITALPVKPMFLYATINADKTMTVTGINRLIDVETPNPGRSVEITFRDRAGDSCKTNSCKIKSVEDPNTVTKGGSGPPSEYPVFKRWNFTTTVPISEGISSFSVQITDKTKTGATTAVYTNNGHGYPYDDTMLVQPHLSCFNPSPDGFLNLTIAVRDDSRTTTLSGDIEIPVFPPGTVYIPQVRTTPLKFSKIGAVPGSGYTLYNAQSQDDPTIFHKIYNVVGTGGGRTFKSSFNMAEDLSPCGGK